jgi:hypothetical protein
MIRREFITLLGSAGLAWPLAARAQQGQRMRRIGVLMGFNENDPEGKLRYSAFTQALADFGWTDGRNVRVDLRWGLDINQIRALAQELVGLQPDIILTNGTPPTAAVLRETQTIPIVFASADDPVASGIVARLNQPGGNITGFAVLEASLGSKWLELLSEIAPGLKRAAIMFNPDTAPASAYMPSFETAALSLKVEAITAPVHSDAEIETAASRADHIGAGPKQGTDNTASRLAPKGTLQDRLPKELKLAGIDEIAAVSRFIRNVYLPAHNARFAKASNRQVDLTAKRTDDVLRKPDNIEFGGVVRAGRLDPASVSSICSIARGPVDSSFRAEVKLSCRPPN